MARSFFFAWFRVFVLGTPAGRSKQTSAFRVKRNGAGICLDLLDVKLKKWTYLAEGGDEGDKADDSGIGEELGDLSDSADVLLSVGKGESEILVESVSDVVTVEDVCGDTLGDKVLLELHGDGGFTGSGETGEPDSAAVEAT